VFTWNGAAFSWGRKRQATVFSSTAEAEYVAAVAATLDALWVRKLMLDLFQPALTVNMAEDNQACLSLISIPETTGKVKHIDIAHCRITRPSTRPLAGPEVVGTPGDANDVSRPGSDRWRCRCWVGS